MLENDLNPRLLMDAAKNGDAAAFGRLFEKYQIPVFRYFYSRLRDRDRAEDFTQNVFLKVYRNSEKIDWGDNPLKYFFTAARNILIDHWRKKQEILLDDEEKVWQTLSDTRPTPIDLVEQAEISEILRQALAGLEEEDAEIVALKYFAGLPAKIIAEIFGLTEATVRQRQCRALKALRKFLPEEF